MTQRLARKRWLPLLLLCISGLLAACVGPMTRPLTPGMSHAEVLERWGTPSATYPATARLSERWQYSMQPGGQHVLNVDFDAQGQLQAVQQVLDEGLFEQRIVVDTWQREDVLREYGHPAEIRKVHNFDGQIWVWRYLQGPWWRLLFIDIDPDGVVRGWSLGDEDLPDPPEPR